MRVLTYNIHHCQDENGIISLQRIAAVIRENKIDLAALQEVDRYLLRSRFCDQARCLAYLAKRGFIFGATRQWLRVFQYGNTILSSYPVLKHHNYLLPFEKERRGLLVAKVKIVKQPIFFLNTHLGLSKKERHKQIREINNIINHLNAPLILAGDFNTEPNTREMLELSPKLRLVAPPKQENQVSYPYHPTFPSSAPKFSLDHILVSPEWVIKSSTTISTTASDHLPLLAELELSSNNSALRS